MAGVMQGRLRSMVQGTCTERVEMEDVTEYGGMAGGVGGCEMEWEFLEGVSIVEWGGCAFGKDVLDNLTKQSVTAIEGSMKYDDEHDGMML